jgi:hypothetical protein
MTTPSPEKRKRNPKERLLDMLAALILGAVVVFVCVWAIRLVIGAQATYQTDFNFRALIDNLFGCTVGMGTMLLIGGSILWAINRIIFPVPDEEQPQ